MRKLPAVLVIVSVLWLTGLSAIGPNVHLAVPGTSGVWRSGGSGLTVVAFGDDAGGGH
jgi:hypothetical protein